MNFKNLICLALIMTILSSTLVSSQSFAQVAEETTTTKTGPRKQLSIIFLSGLGGAVLGLSTLSFYARPQDHMGKIALGFAIGVVFGTAYVTYNTAKKPREFLSELSPDDTDLYKNKTSRSFLETKETLPALTYTFNF